MRFRVIEKVKDLPKTAQLVREGIFINGKELLIVQKSKKS